MGGGGVLVLDPLANLNESANVKLWQTNLPRARSLPSIRNSGTLSANPLIERVTTLRAYMHPRTACRKLNIS